MNAQKRSEKNLLMRHRVQATRDRRRLGKAVELAIDLNDHVAMTELYSIAWRYGDVRSVLRLHSLDFHPESDMSEWLCSFALPRFDCYTDPEAKTYLLESEDAEFIGMLLKTLSTSWKSAIEVSRLRCRGVPDFRFTLLELAACGKEAIVPWNEFPVSAEEAFRTYAYANDIEILRYLQTHERFVCLVRDTDGIVKVFKQQDVERDDCYDRFEDTELTLNGRICGIKGIARCFGTTKIGPYEFLRFECAYGQSLLDFVKNGGSLSSHDARFIIGGLAEMLAKAHDAHVAHLDLRPENIVVDGNVVALLDFGDSRTVKDARSFSTTHLQDPWYAPPEVILRAEGGCASDVFQLGVLFHQLMTGQHPFLDRLESKPDDERVYDALANLTHESALDERMPCSGLIKAMLSKDPFSRPSMARIASQLRTDSRISVRHPKRTLDRVDGSLIIVPARMAVPHRGHIDLLSRLLDIGYRLIVSLQYSYFHDEENPIPKWILIKMIAASLRRRGHDPDRITWMCTPMFRTDEAHRLHFSMMHGREEIRAVATGNPKVMHLFPGFERIDQRALFGIEGESYQTRSWGHLLRKAIRDGEMGAYNDLIADGVEEVLSFEEIRALCLSPVFPNFVWGEKRVIIRLCSHDGCSKAAFVSPYGTPEDAISGLMLDHSFKWIDRFSPEAIAEIDGKRARVVYQEMSFNAMKHLCIHYKIKEKV